MALRLVAYYEIAHKIKAHQFSPKNPIDIFHEREREREREEHGITQKSVYPNPSWSTDLSFIIFSFHWRSTEKQDIVDETKSKIGIYRRF